MLYLKPSDKDTRVATMSIENRDLTVVSLAPLIGVREVKTKFSSAFTAYFFLVGTQVRQLFATLVTRLRQDRLWGNDSPLIPVRLMVSYLKRATARLSRTTACQLLSTEMARVVLHAVRNDGLIIGRQ